MGLYSSAAILKYDVLSKWRILEHVDLQRVLLLIGVSTKEGAWLNTATLKFRLLRNVIAVLITKILKLLLVKGLHCRVLLNCECFCSHFVSQIHQAVRTLKVVILIWRWWAAFEGVCITAFTLYFGLGLERLGLIWGVWTTHHVVKSRVYWVNVVGERVLLRRLTTCKCVEWRLLGVLSLLSKEGVLLLALLSCGVLDRLVLCKVIERRGSVSIWSGWSLLRLSYWPFLVMGWVTSIKLVVVVFHAIFKLRRVAGSWVPKLYLVGIIIEGGEECVLLG
jgi:hypothetical protein